MSRKTKSIASGTEYRDDWYTPKNLIDSVSQYFNGQIPLDPATAKHNPTKAKRYYTKEIDGLVQDWDEPCFINPPYSTSNFMRWTERIGTEAKNGLEIVALLPINTRINTRAFQYLWNENLNAICWIKGRVPFTSGDGRTLNTNLYASAFFGFNVDTTRFLACFKCYGPTYKTRKGTE